MGEEAGKNDSTLMTSQGLLDYLKEYVSLDLAQGQWKAISKFYTAGWQGWINILRRSLKLQYDELRNRPFGLWLGLGR